jgi:hypothetical protein
MQTQRVLPYIFILLCVTRCVRDRPFYAGGLAGHWQLNGIIDTKASKFKCLRTE